MLFQFVLALAVSVFTNRACYEIVAARADRYKIIFDAFVRDFDVAVRAVMHLQSIARSVFSAQAAALSIQFDAGF